MMCPVQSICGGCPVLHLSRADELEGKRKWVAEAFAQHDIQTEIGGPISVGGRAGYRNRLRMKVEHGLAELFNPAKAQGCVVLRPELWEAIQHLQAVTRERPDLLGGVDHVEVRVADEVGAVGLSLVDRSGVGDSGQLGVLRGELGRGWRVQWKGHPEQPRLAYEISDDCTLQVPIDSFVQVNSAVNRSVVSEVGAEVGRIGARSFIDLYSGAGNLTFPLLSAGLPGVVVERNGSAIAALVDQADQFDVRALVGDVDSWVESLEVADAVLCNPARSGLASQHERIARLTQKVLLYVGCNPATLARDVALLVSHGLEVKSIRTFDMFPGTRHIETVVTMQPA